MARASILAAPSVTAASGDSEGLPIAICEAQAMGLPVVATHHAGIPEVVEDGVTGFLAREKSVEELRAAIEKILEGQSLRESMGKAARGRAVASFSLTDRPPSSSGYMTRPCTAAPVPSRMASAQMNTFNSQPKSPIRVTPRIQY